jgi:hypothetical protein
MLDLMRNPKEPPGPPPAPREPFLLLQTPPTGTLLGLAAPPAMPRASAPAPAQAPAARPSTGTPLTRPRSDLGDLERTAEGLRVELAYFRQWLPGQVVHLARLAGAPRRALQGQVLAGVAGVALALLLALVSGAAALSWPAYGRLIAHAARLPAPGTSR